MHRIAPLYKDMPTPEEMGHWDQSTINEHGHPAVMLMETASRGALQFLLNHHKLNPQRPIVVYIGTGNNGGDGIALARHLHELGYTVTLLALKPLDKLPSPAKEHWDMAQKCSVPLAVLPTDKPAFLPEGFQQPGIIVDAIMGMGLNKPLSPYLQAVINNINSFYEQSLILSLDIPSGLCGLTGRPLPVAIRAHATITFEATKPGLALPEASQFTGDVIVHSIGIPQGVKIAYPSSWLLLTPQNKAFVTLKQNLHKGSAGKVLVIGGSTGMEGAPVLSALAALRTGSGLVKILCPEKAAQRIHLQHSELLVEGIGNNDWHGAMANDLVAIIENFGPDAIVMGMGMGRTNATAQIVHTVLGMKSRCPVVLDADGLFALAQEQQFGLELKSLLTGHDIITPHPLEATRLLPSSFYDSAKGLNPIEFLQNNRASAIRALSGLTSAVTVLKGAGTLIHQKNHPVILAPYDIPALAVAGSGDVLAGIIGSLLGKQKLLSPFRPIDIASFAVYLHAEAGLLLSKKCPQGNLASEIAHAVPEILAKYCNPHPQ